jgi:hypothetical protein
MSDEIRYGDRQFLNLEGFHEDASISYCFTVGENGYFNGGINIRDCGENICLEIDVHSDDWMENSEFKVDTLIRLLRAAKQDMRKARKDVARIKKAKKSTSDGR